MVFPIINNVYDYNGEEVIVWAQDPFKNVFCRTNIDSTKSSATLGSTFVKYNWWKFMLHAKFIKKLPKRSSAY